jgi:hypothetical protein
MARTVSKLSVLPIAIRSRAAVTCSTAASTARRHRRRHPGDLAPGHVMSTRNRPSIRSTQMNRPVVLIHGSRIPAFTGGLNTDKENGHG